MTTIAALLIMAVGMAGALAVGVYFGFVISGYSQKVRNEEASRKIVEHWMKGKPVQSETEARIQ